MTYQNKMDYIRAVFAPESERVRAARESMEAGQNDRICIYPEEGKFLQVLMRAVQVRSVIEIGTLGGYSALWMAEALPADGKIITIEKDPSRAAMARVNTAHEQRIEIAEGDAHEVLKTMTPGFDMAFIDADKISYGDYLDACERLVRKGGLIIGDNTLLFDAVWMKEVPARVRQTALDNMRTFNKRLSDPDKYAGIMLPTVEGMTIAVKLFD